MSGDTPSLDCPDCGSRVFIREAAAWFTDEEEHCAGCGSRVMVALDEDSADPDLLTARVYIYEHGGDVVARLRAEAEQLKYELDYTPPTGAVGDHVRKRISEAGRAALDGKGACLGEACIPAHQAGEVLDAHDDAQAEVERLTAERNFIDDQRIEQGRNLRAEVERLTERDRKWDRAHDARLRSLVAADSDVVRLTRERDAAKARSASDGRVVVQMGIRNREMMGARDDAQARLADVIGWATRAHKSKDWSTYAVLEGLLSRLRSLCPEDTPKPGGIVEAFAALREACAGEYDGVDAAAFVDELRGKGPEDSTTEANPAKGVDAFFGTMTSEETDEEFLAMVGADGNSTTDETSHTEKTDRPQQESNGTDDEENEQPQMDPDLRALDQRPAPCRGARRRLDRDVDGDQHDGGIGDREAHAGGPAAERATQDRGDGGRAPRAEGGLRGDGSPRGTGQPVGTTDGTDEMTVWREWAKASMISVEEHEANRALEAAEDVAASAPTCECGPGARAVDGVCTDCSLQVETGGDQ